MSELTNSQAADLLKQIEEFQQKSTESGLIPLIAIIGPTASGKTALAITLAQLLNGEIVSADSRQIYREMDIGTAKATAAEQAAAKHHLIDIADPDQTISLSEFQKQATTVIKHIHASGHQPILAGGTGLYISAITQNYQLPDSKPSLKLRSELEQYAKTYGVEALHKKLQDLDPTSAARIHPNNLRYVIRALEINKQTNQPKSDQRAASEFATFFITVEWPREQLYERINQRIDQQMSNGLLEETRQLLSKYPAKLPSLSSLGYQELGQFLREEIPLEKALEDFKQNTRNFAKRQLTWFRKYRHVYSIDGETLSDFIAELAKLKS